VALEVSPVFGVWHMTIALFFAVGALGVALGLLIGYSIGALARHVPRLATNRLDALDQMNQVQKAIEAGNLGQAARLLGITDKQANAWTFQQLQSHVEVRAQAIAKKAIG